MKKRMLAMLLALLLVLGTLPGTALADNVDSEGFTLISTEADLKAISENLCGSYRLANNIELTMGWSPLGSPTSPFTGKFDGNGFIISGISITRPADDYVGLFGYSSGTVTDLVVLGKIKGGNYVGGIAGCNTGIIKNCGNEITISTGADISGNYIGGIAGYNTGTIENCYNKANISSNGGATSEAGRYVGGIVGSVSRGSSVSNCYNTGNVAGENRNSAGYVGGIANFDYNETDTNNTFINCFSTGQVTSKANNKYVGSILGYGVGKTGNLLRGTVENCFYISDDDHKGIGGSTKNNQKDNGTTALTAEYMQSENFSDTLGDAFQHVDGSYPILKWEAAASGPEPTPTPEVPAESITLDQRLSFNLDHDSRTYQFKYTLKPDHATEKPTWESSNTAVASVDENGLMTLQGCGSTEITARIKSSNTGNAYAVCYVTVTSDEEITNEHQAAVDDIYNTLASPSSQFGTVVKEDMPSVSMTTSPVASNRVTVSVSYRSSHPGIISIGAFNNASISRPSAGSNVDVTLTATITAGEASRTKDFVITVWSKENADKDDAFYVSGAVQALGNKLTPVYDQDANILTMAKQKLEEAYNDVAITIQTIGTSKDASISSNGDISYFYHDPEDTSNLVWTASIPVTFTLTKGTASLEHTVNVIVPWDRAKVEAYLNTTILDALSVPAITAADLELSRYLGGKDGKTWVELSWRSSNEDVLSVSDQNQQSGADSIYNPYVGIVTRGIQDQDVNLTVSAKFNRTNGSTGGSEAPIEVTKTFTVRIQAMDGDTAELIRQQLQAKLEAGLAAPGLTDFVTGGKLDTSNVVHDIRFPATRDFGVDGKYYPVTILSSNPDVIEVPDVNNAARVCVYRPLPGEPAETVTLTVRMTENASGVYAEKEIPVTVQPLTQAEIDAEIELMEQVKANYFDGIKNENTSENAITTDLCAFQEAYLKNGVLTWVYDSKDLVNQGIVPVAMDGWDTLEQWRTFRSSNAAVISHENLLVTRQVENKLVTVTSYLSSETLGKYAEKYPLNPDFQKLYYQPVTVSLIVSGTAPTTTGPVEEKLTVSFTLQSADSTWISRTSVTDIPEGATVFDVFTSVLHEKGYGYASRGSSVYAITSPGGVTLKDMDAGLNSGWMYKVNGYIPSVYMAAHPLRNGDNIVVFFTKDYTQETAWSDKPVPEMKAETSVNPDGSFQVDLMLDGKKVESAPDGVKVCIPNVGDGQVVVIVNADGTETVVKKSVIADGKAYLLLDRSATIKIKDAENPFVDVDAEDWYGDAVVFAVSRELFNGTAEGVFDPQGPMTRGMLATVLFRLEDTPNAPEHAFADVDADSWYADAVSWAAATGIVTGNGDGAFSPDERVSRQQLVTMLYRYAASAGINTSGRARLDPYADAGQVAGYAADALAWAVDSGLIQGRADVTLAPDASVTRAEVAAIFLRLTDLLVR